jgi:hypothetical protein
MDLNAPESLESDWQYAGENLRRLKTSGVYYVHARRGGKQFRRSLHTTDKATARWNEAERQKAPPHAGLCA